MIDISKIDYSVLDRPEVSMALFHPRPELRPSGSKNSFQDVLIPVEDNVVIGATFHLKEKSAPNILFFHGNGEIVSDYDELGIIYNGMNINFLPVDYRGYGRSTGKSCITAMIKDAHLIFEFVMNWFQQNRYNGPMIVMGRSLGSASALELAANYNDRFDGLIIESGFAYAAPLLQLIGVNIKALGFSEKKGFRNADKIKNFDKSTLIIHAKQDQIIPFSDGQKLYEASQSNDKTFLEIPGANHNNIFQRGFQEYMTAVKTLAEKVSKIKENR